MAAATAASTSPRFGYWVAFFIFSTITLGATIEAQAHTDRLSPAAQSNQRYAVACATILFLLSIMVVILHTKPLLSSIILGTKIEGFIILVLITFWTALVAIVSDTRHGLATDSSGSIANGNLYYFSWAGLATGVALFTSFLRSTFGFDIGGELRSRAERLQQWVWAGMLGLVQMGSSARLFDNHCGDQSGLGEAEIGTITFCRRCQLGIGIEMVLSGMIAGGQAGSVGFLTGQEGPAAPLNNLYYSTWGALAIGLVLVGSCVENWSTAKSSLRDGEEERRFTELSARSPIIPAIASMNPKVALDARESSISFVGANAIGYRIALIGPVMIAPSSPYIVLPGLIDCKNSKKNPFCLLCLLFAWHCDIVLFIVLPQISAPEVKSYGKIQCGNSLTTILDVINTNGSSDVEMTVIRNDAMEKMLIKYCDKFDASPSFVVSADDDVEGTSALHSNRQIK
eukprot:scaffold12061_cov146-Skeletonema_menzelii.AAC.1